MDLRIFVNGRFWSPGAAIPEASCLVTRGGRIESVLPEGAWMPLSEDGPGGIRVVDLGGRAAVPGPVDAHCHLVSYGMIRLREADLRGCRSLEEAGERLREHAARLRLRPGDGRWLLGRGFDQELLPEGRWPTRHDLDRIAAEVPLRITRVCGHAVAANTAALRAAGLAPEEQSARLPEGVLTEERIGPLSAAIPEPTDPEWLEAARWACAEAARVGFVGVHSLMAHAAEVRALVDLRREGPLPVRVTMQLPYALLEHASGLGLRTGFGDDTLRVGAVKLFSDGSLGARTAALLQPYSDDPSSDGELIHAPEALARKVTRVYEAGFQVCIHAIGDRAMQATLDAIQAAQGIPNPFPPRIEHASLVNADLVSRMKDLGVGAAIQPQFARSDCWAPDRLGEERARGCYAFRTLWEAGIPLAGSTDCPVEPLDALAALGQLVHRPPWSPDEGLPLEAALRVFSEGSYALLGCPPGTGQLAVGEYADFLVLEEDPRAAPPEAIEKIPVAMTVVGGRISFRARHWK
jgi:predicted amidohydrolase YtcJ